MEKRQVGASDLAVTMAGLGCNNFGGRLDAAGSEAVVAAALDRGIGFFDTADSYGGRGESERILGTALGARRKDVVIATKFGWPMDDEGKARGASRRYVFEAAEASLQRLKTDWIDLYQLHLPDPDTPVEETLGALSDLVVQGKIRFAGCSNMEPAMIEAATNAARSIGFEGFVSCQAQYNMLEREVETGLIPQLKRAGMSLIPFAPLASGALTGKFRKDKPLPADTRIANSPRHAQRYLSDTGWETIEALIAFGESRDRTLLDLAIAWVAANRTVCSVISGAMTAEQVRLNAAAVEWRLSDADLAEIRAILDRDKS